MGPNMEAKIMSCTADNETHSDVPHELEPSERGELWLYGTSLVGG